MRQSKQIQPADGKLAVLLPGLGAVATTFIAGVLLARRGLGEPIGSLTQLGSLPMGARGRTRLRLNESLPLATLSQLEFCAWDLFEDSAWESARHAEVLEARHLEPIREELEAIKPRPAAFYPQYVRRLHGTHVKRAASKAAMVEQLREDIRRFMADKGCERAVAIWTGSTETYVAPTGVHQSVEAFERGLREDDPSITNSQLYAWAFLQERVPFANGAPNLTVDFPAAWELARRNEVPIAGKDFKTGQTLMKTVLAPAFKARMLGIRGWFSTNILGNRDGEVLDDAESFKTKELSKLGVLDSILEPADHEALYGQLSHKVCIEYYPPRGDAKEGWDNIDLFGWLRYPMQLKVNFLCRDSILAAPIVLDLALLMDLAARSGGIGTQEWLSFYFKSPLSPAGTPVHDLFRQLDLLHGHLRSLLGSVPARLSAAKPHGSADAAHG